MRILLTNFHPKKGGGHVTYVNSLIRLNQHASTTIGVASPRKSRIYRILKNSNYPYLYDCDFPAKLKDMRKPLECFS